MNRITLLSTLTLVSVALLSLHISQDIVFGLDKAGLNHLTGIAMLFAITCGAVLLRDGRLGRVIMLLGGVFSLGMLPLHMRNGLRAELLQADGALLFVWTLYLLGVPPATVELRLGEQHGGLAETLIGPAQLPVLALELLHPLRVARRQAGPPAFIAFRLPHPPAQGLRGTPHLVGDRPNRESCVRRPGRCEIPARLKSSTAGGR